MLNFTGISATLTTQFYRHRASLSEYARTLKRLFWIRRWRCVGRKLLYTPNRVGYYLSPTVFITSEAARMLRISIYRIIGSSFLNGPSLHQNISYSSVETRTRENGRRMDRYPFIENLPGGW